MKHCPFALTASPAAMLQPAWAQDRIYRCGNEYTNNAAQAKERGCKLVEGGNVTVEGTRPAAAPAGGAAAPSAVLPQPASNAPASRRPNSALATPMRAILQDELRKAESRLADLRKEYNDGAPQRSALELRNPQGYIERTAELKAAVTRAEADVAGIKRELGRLGN